MQNKLKGLNKEYDEKIARLKTLRKVLGMTQKEFALSINLAQTSYSEIENFRSRLTDRNIDAICREHNANAEWLKRGVGDIFKKNNDIDLIEELRKKYKLDKLTTEVVKNFLELDKKTKEDFIKYFVKMIEYYYINNPKKIEKLIENVKK